MAIVWPQPQPLTAAERLRLRVPLDALGTSSKEAAARVMNSVLLQVDVRPKFVGRVYLLEVGGLPVALARNAYSRYFPSVEGAGSATFFAAQLEELERWKDESKANLILRPIYLASPITSTYCAALAGPGPTQLHLVAEFNVLSKQMRIRTANEFLEGQRELIGGLMDSQPSIRPGESPTN